MDIDSLFDNLEDITLLQESIDIECKLAGGKDGKGQLPEDFWKTYSSFANTRGGYIILGLKEKNNSFNVVGIENIQKVKDEFFNLAHNTEKVNVNLLNDDDIIEKIFDNKTVLIFHIPFASKQHKPVYIKGNTKYTYKRNATGDYLCSESEIEAMIRDKSPESIDAKIIESFGIEDFNQQTIRSYRQIYNNLQPNNAFIDLSEQDFLIKIGALKKDRQTDKIFTTKAGLLMFGEYIHIKEHFPNFFLDYREDFDPRSDMRLTHRIAPDDSWSGNIFDFYYKVIRRLTSDLSVPFKLKGIYRDENTPIHIALREALTNTLIHADYHDTASILVMKNENEFIFENPGNTIQPLQNLIQNVTQSEKIDSECRNKTLQDMFRRIQIGEALGSGLHTIYRNWEAEQWQAPDLSEQRHPSKMILKLKTIELFHVETIKILKQNIPHFDSLSDDEKRILVHCFIEGQITHERIMSIISNIHRKDLTKTLYDLTNKGLLQKHGIGRGMKYTLVLSEHEQASLFEKISESVGLPSDSVGLPSDSVGLPSDSVGLPSDSVGLPLDSVGLPPDSVGLPSDSVDLHSESVALPSDSIEFPKKMPLNDLVQHVLKLCRQKPYKISELKKELGRNPDYLRNRILKPLIEKGELSLLYPDKPNSPKQAYKVNEQFTVKQGNTQ